jgi:predicted amidophosphoribosyltransferase
VGEDDEAWLASLRPAPLGFPACRGCQYRTLDRCQVCLVCSGAGPGAGSAGSGFCPVCGQPSPAGGRRCNNDWCARGDRWWSVVWSIAAHAGTFRDALFRYKYRGESHWADVFGRLLVGFLDDRMPWFDDYDALLGVPSFLGPGARRPWDPVGRILEVAGNLAGTRWPIEADVILKTAETPPMAGLSLGRRRKGAEGALRQALVVPEPGRVSGARLLVVDDVFTEGSTLREVARALQRAGAVEVAGLTLARQPWPVAPRPG